MQKERPISHVRARSPTRCVMRRALPPNRHVNGIHVTLDAQYAKQATSAPAVSVKVTRRCARAQSITPIDI